MSITNKLLLIFFTVFIFYALSARLKQEKQYTIMIDPAGDARHTGRIIDDNFERTITFQIAKTLQQTLTNALPCTVIITRSPGEVVYPLQSATFANRLPIDLYLSLHCYHAPQEKHAIALYLLSRGDAFVPKTSELAMVPFTKAHIQSSETTKKYAATMYTTLQTNYAHQFQISQPAALPFTPLLGIQAPALGIELNCLSLASMHAYIEPLVQSIITALTS